MTERYPVISGAEAWSAPGEGELARVGIAVVHGFTGNPVSTRPLGEALAARGFAVEVPRLPGHGTHWRDMMQTRYSDWRREVERVLDELRGRTDVVVLAGLSMGGTLALDVASARASDVAGVVSINAAVLDREGILPKIAPLLERLLPAVPAAAAGLVKNDIAKPGMDERAYPMVPNAAANSLLAELPRIRRQLERCTLPALVAYSPGDHSVPPENSTAVLGLLAGDDVHELRLERSYHVATLDYDFHQLEAGIAEFARARAPGSA